METFILEYHESEKVGNMLVCFVFFVLEYFDHLLLFSCFKLTREVKQKKRVHGGLTIGSSICEVFLEYQEFSVEQESHIPYSHATVI